MQVKVSERRPGRSPRAVLVEGVHAGRLRSRVAGPRVPSDRKLDGLVAGRKARMTLSTAADPLGHLRPCPAIPRSGPGPVGGPGRGGRGSRRPIRTPAAARANSAARGRSARLQQRIDLHRRRTGGDLPQGGRSRCFLPVRQRVPADRGRHRRDPAGRWSGDIRRVRPRPGRAHRPSRPGRPARHHRGADPVGGCRHRRVHRLQPRSGSAVRRRRRDAAGTLRRSRRTGDGQRPHARPGRRTGPRGGHRAGAGTRGPGRPRLGGQGAGLGGPAPRRRR